MKYCFIKCVQRNPPSLNVDTSLLHEHVRVNCLSSFDGIRPVSPQFTGRLVFFMKSRSEAFLFLNVFFHFIVKSLYRYNRPIVQIPLHNSRKFTWWHHWSCRRWCQQHYSIHPQQSRGMKSPRSVPCRRLSGCCHRSFVWWTCSRLEKIVSWISELDTKWLLLTWLNSSSHLIGSSRDIFAGNLGVGLL